MTLGAIASHMIGSVHEHTATKSVDFELFVEESAFTDDATFSARYCSPAGSAGRAGRGPQGRGGDEGEGG